MKRLFLIAALLVAGAAGAQAAAPSKQEVLQAIEVMEKNVGGPAATEAAKTIVIYAQVSDDVMVDIGPDQLPWIEEKWPLAKEEARSRQSLLMAAFVAGNIKSQIKNDKAEDDTYSGWIFAIETYRRLQSRGPFVSPAIEALSKLQQQGKLLQHAREVHANQDRNDSSDSAPRPLARLRPSNRSRA